MNKEPKSGKLLKLHTGIKTGRPIGKIEVGFLQQFLDHAQSELKNAIIEDRLEFDYE